MTLPQNIPEFVFGNPELMAVLVALLYGLVRLQRQLGYRQYRFLHLGKAFVFQYLDTRATQYGRPLIRGKHRPDESDEYLTTTGRPPYEVYHALSDAGASPHLIATVKQRPNPDGTPQTAHSQLVVLHDDGTQTEYYLFRTANNGTDVYGHRETAVTDPEGHVSDAQHPAALPEGLDL